MKKIFLSIALLLFTAACSSDTEKLNKHDLAFGITQTYGTGFESAINLLKKGDFDAADITEMKGDSDGFRYTLKNSIHVETEVMIDGDDYVLTNKIQAPLEAESVDDVSMIVADALSDDAFQENIKKLIIDVMKDKAKRQFKDGDGEGTVEVEGDQLVITMKQF